MFLNLTSVWVGVIMFSLKNECENFVLAHDAVDAISVLLSKVVRLGIVIVLILMLMLTKFDSM